jgi:NAD(P)H-hydrate epimerase
MPIRPLRPLSREEVRSIDARAVDEIGMPTVILMENAGRGAAEVLRSRVDATQLPSVLILCGPGNNGGDGAVVARHLENWGFGVSVVWFADPSRLRGDALVQWSILNKSGTDQTAWSGDVAGLDALIAPFDWLVDSLLGTGLTRPVEGLLRDVVEAINRSGKPVLALDLPSGLDADLGVPLGVAVKATVTATFVAPKMGFQAPGAVEYTGEVAVADIGAPRELLKSFVLDENRARPLGYLERRGAPSG